MRTWTYATPRASTFDIPGKIQIGSDGGPLATCLAAVHGVMWRHDVRPPSESRICRKKKPAADFPARAFEFFR